ncbi:uncharacterized protein [Triticum aestivum]|uniref:uncharacterized protein isoform X1 n=1 Tax=Triticum aestivum TaxID=4565 RepID=UPI001D0036C0|nr:uncharacterized protein LOC123166890 isoform X1 [Triticum aestivum]XP_044445755.1 uncharacterized protein LOC123172938 isoform X1 [Triticum aestivum]
MCAVVMDGGLFSGGLGAGFALVFQVEYWGDGGDVPRQATVVVRFRSKSGLSEEQEYKAFELRHMNQAPRIRWSTEPVLCLARKGGTVNLATQWQPLRLMTFSNHDDLPSLLKYWRNCDLWQG